jgi:hypothetical protein
MAALVRVITYAREEAKRLEADVLAFCLDAAVVAASQESSRLRLLAGSGENRTGTGQKKPTTTTPIH